MKTTLYSYPSQLPIEGDCCLTQRRCTSTPSANIKHFQWKLTEAVALLILYSAFYTSTQNEKLSHLNSNQRRELEEAQLGNINGHKYNFYIIFFWPFVLNESFLGCCSVRPVFSCDHWYLRVLYSNNVSLLISI